MTPSRTCARPSTSTSSKRSSGSRNAPGITLRYDDKSQAKDRSRKTRLSEAVGAAIEFYHRLLLEAPEGGAARRYLRSRGFDGDAARRFPLGWSPDGWDGLSRWLQQERKLSRDDVIGAGLAFVNKANRLQDQFRSRLMFPIHDARGEPAGFGGRTLTDDGPKYKNSPETPIYQKSRLLYGLNWAKAEIVARGDVVICEGYTDVMAFALAGVPNAVATCGTALADDHVRALKNLARKVTLAYDADAAGQGAAEQWYRWEHEYEIQVRVADLPPGRDPGDLWTDDRPTLLAALEHASRSCSSGSTARSARPTSRRSKGAAAPPRWRRRSWPSTRAISCATSTSWSSPVGSRSTRTACVTRSPVRAPARRRSARRRHGAPSPNRSRNPKRRPRR